ncbi:BolA family transcriptional regulator [Corticibacter populi]|uniref:BolA family transcriptional regulator n=1 Tax=Corticibacter populi TaxID=1550736 RepID=A0A3M6R074_9BURK|nr:BolA family protein [Corticibacter populi]RMX08279.1 BolA family transcriptional regulator [Corticibacter populi]RZS35558.1 BolA protein family transcriptional regulator [Corticibacter populi]
MNDALPLEAVTASAIEARLREKLLPTELVVIDESHQHSGHAGANGSGFGTHFRVHIASPLFLGKSRVAAHRLVYDALRDCFDAGLHALAIEVTG